MCACLRACQRVCVHVNDSGSRNSSSLHPGNSDYKNRSSLPLCLSRCIATGSPHTCHKPFPKISPSLDFFPPLSYLYTCLSVYIYPSIYVTLSDSLSLTLLQLSLSSASASFFHAERKLPICSARSCLPLFPKHRPTCTRPPAACNQSGQVVASLVATLLTSRSLRLQFVQCCQRSPEKGR